MRARVFGRLGLHLAATGPGTRRSTGGWYTVAGLAAYGHTGADSRMSEAHDRPLLLLVEDHADTRQMYAEFLGSSFNVLEAGDGRQALEVLRRHVPAVVITDFSLPGIDGFELTRRIRGNASTRDVPVICLSGYSGNRYEQQAREVGCDRVIEKPCLPDVLAAAAHEMAVHGRPTQS